MSRSGGARWGVRWVATGVVAGLAWGVGAFFAHEPATDSFPGTGATASHLESPDGRPAPPFAAFVAGTERRPPALAAAAPQQYELRHFPYDGRFTFSRIRFSTGMQRGFGRGGPLWAHDYPIGEVNFLKILTEVTNVRAQMEGSNVFTFDDPELTRYPIAYIVEVGAWSPTPSEVEGLRGYLQKGGFLIVDDFRSNREFANFQEQMRRVLPGHQIHQLDESHEIFNSFFEIESLDVAPPTFRGYPPYYLGIFEDNDPARRLLAIINFNNDLGEYWEYSDMGYYPIDLSNEAYKLSVNYFIYALTH